MIVEYKNYVNSLQRAMLSVDTSSVQRAADFIVDATKERRTIFVCGNGGSAAIADHLTCDCLKGIRNDTDMKPRVAPLSSNGPLITAIANDMSYDKVFAYQLQSLTKPNFFLFFLFVLFLAVLFGLAKGTIKSYQVDSEVLQLKGDISRLEDPNQDFKQLVNYLKTDSFIEQEAKLKMGYIS